MDGTWGSLSGSACLIYLIQRYTLMGTPRMSIYLYSFATSINSLTKLGHQVDVELSVFQIGTKETVKALKTLKELNVKLEQGLILISDSQTCMSICSRSSSMLDLSTSLIVCRVHEVFTKENLFFAPRATFRKSADLLTRYKPDLKVDKEFYSPSWLLPEIGDRVTVKVANMRHWRTQCWKFG